MNYISSKPRRKPPLVIVLAGLPGTGKSTLARKLARRYGLEHISTDSVRKRIFRDVRRNTFGRGSYSTRQRMVVYDTIYYVLYTLLKNGVGCVLDGTFYQERLRSKVRRICARFDAMFVLVIVDCPDSIISKRFKEREKRTRRTLSDADSQIYEKFKKLFEPTRLPHIEVNMAFEHNEILERINDAITGKDTL
ncbi:MAG: nucleoside monophosphate kinase [Candidatus Heimdallarchaeota archaeon]|nr:AAA family ATPase [Candidatus Heimdallarchaeota archaeon]MCG3254893.1 nucleoside monophosphate kinase [Candidatus Heimdallarchaeota archaeon]MCK4609968.1 nucleoside monophosphate kinase [Candidatus Heimdallarchaeota archaeon]